MFSKTLQIRADKKTFPTGIPPYLKIGSQTIDTCQALMMLGNFTIPSGLSVASPAVYWAWIRYFAAISPLPALQVTKPFVDLDPHLKSVLSDDFGVAVTMQWLNDSVKGFKQVVDGRLFVLNYAYLLQQVPPPSKKVGPQKSPDFLVLDAADKWHVIECKGTQISSALSARQLRRAREQKSAVDIKPAFKGLSLAAGLFLASESSGKVSRVLVQDPENPEPLIRVENADLAYRAACRVTTARCFGLSGMPQLAYEAAFAETDDARLQDLFTGYERARSQLPLPERLSTALTELSVARQHFNFEGQEYTGRQISLEIPWPSNGYQPRRVTVSQGVRSQYLEAIHVKSPYDLPESIEHMSKEFIGDESLSFQKSENAASLLQGRLYVCTIRFD